MKKVIMNSGFSIICKLDLQYVEFIHTYIAEGIGETTLDFLPSAFSNAPIIDFTFRHNNHFRRKISGEEPRCPYAWINKISIRYPNKFEERIRKMIMNKHFYSDFIKECTDGRFEAFVNTDSVTKMSNRFKGHSKCKLRDKVFRRKMNIEVFYEIAIEDDLKNFMDKVAENDAAVLSYHIDGGINRCFKSKEEIFETYGYNISTEITEFVSTSGETIYRLELDESNIFSDKDECIAFCKRNGLTRYIEKYHTYEYDGTAVERYSDVIEIENN